MPAVDAKVSLTVREREIAISAIGARLSGRPTEVAKELLAAIAVLDGLHAPILIWPKDITREEMAAWHEAQAADLREFAIRLALRLEERMRASTPSGERTALELTGSTQTHCELVPTPPGSASSAPVLLEAEREGPLLSDAKAFQGSNDAC